MNKIVDWKCTDKDTLQYIRKISDKVYMFKEFKSKLFNPVVTNTLTYIQDREKLNIECFMNKYWNNSDVWNKTLVDLNAFTKETINNITEAYDIEYDGECITLLNGEYYKDDARVAKMIFQHNPNK